MAWFVLMVVFSARGKPRAWLAGHLEKGCGPLLDRVNALVFLGGKKAERLFNNAILHQGAIEAQASKVLEKAQPRNPFPMLRARWLMHFVGLRDFPSSRHALVLQPFRACEAAEGRVEIRARPRPVEAAAGKPPRRSSCRMPMPPRKRNPGAKCRITDPASDMKATKVDVVPLEIEAASNQSLDKVSWALSVNGGGEQPRPLDAPAEPHYAVYQPTLALDELRLSDWDVVSYYAKASTDDGGSSSSEMYFIDIKPFREDIMKMPGGEQGSAFKKLQEMTTFIERQRLILRQTHRYNQAPDSDLKVREEDRKKLQEAESELGDTVTQYYSKLAADFENQPIAETLDHLAMAGTYIDRATTSLRNDFASQAIPTEQSALTELVATRKNFQKFINEHPDAFKDPDQDSTHPYSGRPGNRRKSRSFAMRKRRQRIFSKKPSKSRRSFPTRRRTRPRATSPAIRHLWRHGQEGGGTGQIACGLRIAESRFVS